MLWSLQLRARIKDDYFLGNPYFVSLANLFKFSNCFSVYLYAIYYDGLDHVKRLLLIGYDD